MPHNLISAQESPVAFTKVPDGSQTHNLIVLWVQERNPDILSFLSKSPSKRIPSRFPNGAPMERDTRLQGIFTSLLIYLFISKALRKELPLWKQTPIPEPRALFHILFRVPSKGALPPGPPHGVSSERDAPFLEPSFIHH